MAGLSWKSVLAAVATGTLICSLGLEYALKAHAAYPSGYEGGGIWWRFMPFAYSLFVIGRALEYRRNLGEYWPVLVSLAASSTWISAFLLMSDFQRIGLIPNTVLPDTRLVFCAGVVWEMCGAMWAAVVQSRQAITERRSV